MFPCLIIGNRINDKDASLLAGRQTVFLTSATFISTGLPRFIVAVFPVGYIPYYISVTTFWLFNANSILNTVIYCYKFKEVRQVAKKLFSRQNEVSIEQIEL